MCRQLDCDLNLKRDCGGEVTGRVERGVGGVAVTAKMDPLQQYTAKHHRGVLTCSACFGSPRECEDCCAPKEKPVLQCLCLLG